jgi:2-polyprenyl-3-methyl-5-hydroxy-6-metoxy-1,4-benzoquinol methylase
VVLVTADGFIDTNRASWDERVAGHLVAYGAAALADDPGALTNVVRQDAKALRPHLPGGTVDGLTLLHLQCHIGTDTLSWARLGASVTGIDFSGEAIGAARTLTHRAHVDARFEEATIEDAARTLGGETFDVVYTSIGVLCWLPRLDTWAAAIYQLLRPGGVFYVRDSHPVLNAIDQDRADGLLVLRQPYFGTDQPARDDSESWYTSDWASSPDDVTIENHTTYEWTHSLSEVIQSLIDAGLRITAFAEGRTLPWRALPGLVDSPEGYVSPGDPAAIPLDFSVTARRDS